MSRALVISCNYSQFSCSLYGCHNDADSFIEVLRKIDPNMNIIVMRDNLSINDSNYPTKSNILRELSNLGNANEKLLFFFYSGHGTEVPDTDNDETSILNAPFGSDLVNLQSDLEDSCLVSNDKQNLNLIKDDEICNCLTNLKSDQKLYAFSDSCFSGTLLDLYEIYGANYSGSFINTSINELIPEAVSKCQIIHSSYPAKYNQIKGNVIFISGTRDNAYSYESYVNKIARGHFTTQLVKLINYEVDKLTIKQFYLTIVALLNNSNQIPVLSTSQTLDIDNTLLNDLAFSKIVNNNIPLLLLNRRRRRRRLPTRYSRSVNKRITNWFNRNIC